MLAVNFEAWAGPASTVRLAWLSPARELFPSFFRGATGQQGTGYPEQASPGPKKGARFPEQRRAPCAFAQKARLGE